MFGPAKALLRKVKRRSWMKFALRGVGGNDNFERLDLAYTVEDPWNMDSPTEQSASRRLTASSNANSAASAACSSSAAAKATRARIWRGSPDRLRPRRQRQGDRAGLASPPAAEFAATDLFGQPWGEQPGRFDLVTACEVLITSPTSKRRWRACRSSGAPAW